MQPSQEYVQRLEMCLRLRAGFLPDLLREDDWSFIIKAHAFIEAALAEFLATASDRRLTGLYQGLSVGGRLGKLEFAQSLEIVSPEGARFVRALSRIRNTFVHDVRSTGLSLEEYFNRFDLDQLKGHAADLLAPFHGVSIVRKKGYPFFIRGAKAVIYFGMLITLAEMYFLTHPGEDTDGMAARAYEVAFWKGIMSVTTSMVNAAPSGDASGRLAEEGTG